MSRARSRTADRRVPFEGSIIHAGPDEFAAALTEVVVKHCYDSFATARWLLADDVGQPVGLVVGEMQAAVTRLREMLAHGEFRAAVLQIARVELRARRLVLAACDEALRRATGSTRLAGVEFATERARASACEDGMAIVTTISMWLDQQGASNARRTVH